MSTYDLLASELREQRALAIQVIERQNELAESLSRQLQDAREDNQRKDAEIKRLTTHQPCGHPQAAIVTGEARGHDNYVMYCGWCADVERLREALQAAMSIADTTMDCTYESDLAMIGRIARAALKEPADD